MPSYPFRTLLGLVTLVLAAHPTVGVVFSSRIVHERRATTPQGWSLQRRADPDLVIPLSFALAQSNTHNLEAYLLDIADPTSPNYGKHWTPSRVVETFRPSAKTLDTVHGWLESEGVDLSRTRISNDGGYLDLKLTVAEAEALLLTEYHVYEHEDGTRHVACEDRYHLPEHVSKHVDTVWPTIQFDTVPRSHRTASRRDLPESTLERRKLGNVVQAGIKWPWVSGAESNTEASTSTPSSTVDLSNCDQETTLDCLRALYDFHYSLVAGNKHSIGIVEFGMETLHNADLDVFFQTFDPSQVGKRPQLIKIDGGISNQSITNENLLGESDLDFQYAMGLLGKDATVLQYQVTNMGGPSFNLLPIDQFLGALDADYCKMTGQNFADCGDKPHSNVVSMSYGQPEISFGAAGAQRQCTEFGKLSLTGMTFVQSSGDQGVAAGDLSCIDASGNFKAGNVGFVPGIGVDCPYVVAVGATQVKSGANVTAPNPEQAAMQTFSSGSAFRSGGGFSNFIARPSFQDAAVNNYIRKYTKGLTSANFNMSGRAYPDVAANGVCFQIFVDGKRECEDGTSASAPTFAAMLTAVNDARIAAGKGPIGWANPALYSSAFSGVWNDITEGDNKLCGLNKDLGFSAAPGWDPVTGLGTPDFQKMLTAWLALP